MNDGSPGSDSTEHYDGTPASDEFRGKELPAPEVIGRYRIVSLIARGGFGSVYRATDESLQRDVAIKIPRRKAVGKSDYSRWMSEARIVAMLDHPNIVPVYDAGSTQEHQFYVVSKYIEGSDLRSYLEKQRPLLSQSVDWVIAIAEALQHAHGHGLVHRDVKPSNILIDKEDRPWLTDFGLALREEEIGREIDKNKLIGTLNYMSPEQARGEGHLVDGRADIFSLGVILYELLSGSRPFKGSSSRQLLRNIVYSEPRPIRQWDPRIPVELERICMKALAQRCSDRYSSACDIAEELRQFADQSQSADGSADTTTAVDASADVMVIPKGLRAFDEHDSKFFLKLVPGPCDSDGIPEILRRLKLPIESFSQNDAFRVAMLYGSSGSGKSSLVRAGLMPLLDESVHVVCIESTALETESRLVRALAPMLGDQDGSRGLVSTIAEIRRGALGGGRKVLIILDQFEQWLHAHKVMSGSELVGGLRQCDGAHVQCLVLIRDDFWMPATRFFHELEIPLVQDVNSIAVDRFDLRHARFVLAEFGRAYGCLDKDPGRITREQGDFLNAVIGSVKEDDKVISVHLAVLAQMMKGRPWNLKTLSEFGGTEGVDINYLDATFTGSTASPHHREFEAPAKAVLARLLPDAGTNIKGQMQDVETLRQVSGLSTRRFKQLLEVLDGELRLITPTVAAGEDQDAPSQRGYQLTHDFLVSPMRQWLTRSESQTVRGRAKLRLRELSQYWKTKNENRFLPNVFEYLRIILLTRSANRNTDESKLMSAAGKYHGARAAAATVIVFIAVVAATAISRQIRQRSQQQASGLMVKQLLAADIENVPRVIRAMQPLDDQARTLLKSVVDSDEYLRTEKLNARLALVETEPEQVQPLVEAVTSSQIEEIELICRRMRPHRRQATESLWSIMQSDAVDEMSWLRAALALALLDAKDARWAEYADRLARVVVSQSTPQVIEMAPVLSKLSSHLNQTTNDLFRTSSSNTTGTNAAVILAHTLKASDPLLAELLVTASPPQFEILFGVALTDPQAVMAPLRAELTQKAEHRWPPSQLDPDTPDAGEEVRQALTAAGGLITPHLAICQRMRLQQFENIAEQLTQSGYRPESIRTYLSESETLVAAVWHRDGRSWEFTRHLGPRQAMDQRATMRSRGLLPNDVTPIVFAEDQRDEIEYGVLWGSPDTSVIDARMYLGVREEDHASAWGPLNDEQFVPKSNLKLLHPDGEIRYCSVRQKRLLHPRYDDAWNDSTEDYQSRMLDGWHQVDARMNPRGKLEDEISWAATWWNGGPMESKTLNLLDLQTHQQRCRELAEQGFRPVSISVVDSGSPMAASVWHRPHLTEDDQDTVASRQANALIALLRLGDAESLWPLLESKPDSRLRSFLIDRLAALGTPPQVLVNRLLGDPNDSRRFAIIAALAQYRPEQLPVDQAERLRRFIRRWGTTDPSSGIHSICEYFARRWGWDDVLVEIGNAKEPDGEYEDGPSWFTNGQGQTLAVITGPVQYQMGSPGHEIFRDHSNETTKQMRIPRSFAIAVSELTLEEYQRFDPNLAYAADYTYSGRCPANSISWYDAARYCRWLSEQEGIEEDQMCYPSLENIGEGFEPPANYLERTGYRLPTEAEWEYACRAMTTTPRHFGYSNDLILKYAWTVENPQHRAKPQMHPVRQLLPNDFGLFDTLGNVMEWCDTRQGSGGATRRVLVDGAESFARGVLRGSAIFYPTTSTRSASREYGRPGYHYPYFGLRIVRTMPSEVDKGKSD